MSIEGVQKSEGSVVLNTTASKATAVRKVTGKVVPVGKLSHEAKKFELEIQNKSVPELNDLLSRQNKILSNQGLLKTLPDKGAKVQARKEQLEKLIESRTRALNEAADLLASLSLGPDQEANNNFDKKPVDTDQMEWKYGGANFIKKFSQANPVDSDDDSDEEEVDGQESSTLKLLVSRSEVPSAGAKKKTKAPSASKMLVVGAKPRFVPTHSVMRTQLPEEAKAEIPLRHAETSSEKTLTPLRGQRTDAIPAENMLKEGKFKTRTLDLQESLELQKEQANRLKKTQLDQAAARLKERLKIGGEQQCDPVQLTKEQLMAYRTPTAKGVETNDDDYNHDHEVDEEEEVYDDADNRYGGNVNFTITEYEEQ